MVRGIERLIDDIRNPRASKKRRKAKIDSIPDLPGLRSRKGPFKAPFILKGAKELAKVLVDLGPEGGNPPIITRHTQEQLDYEANLVRGSENMETTRNRNIRLFEERKQAQPQYVKDVENVLNMQPDPESALLDLFDVAESTQDQELENALAMISASRPRQFSRLNLVPTTKKKRKVSAYSKRFGIELKKLKKLHPRTKVQNLMKKAHRRTRAAMKKK
jgi:hypothetical protein